MLASELKYQVFKNHFFLKIGFFRRPVAKLKPIKPIGFGLQLFFPDFGRVATPNFETGSSDS